ncbi:MAG: PH domain-containing protein [Bryobacterales bacterium]|nr:PH domain-containing protein [Bryobacterales bacterium]
MSGVPVAHMVVRPSTKLLIPHYVLSGLVFVAGIVVYLQYPEYRNLAYALLIVAIVWDVVTIIKHMKRRFVSLTLDGDRLRYEEGMLSKSTRSLNLAKVQDVRVEQSVMGRMLRVGSLTLETAGETGRLTMENIDSPQQVADHILALARRAKV